MIKKPDFGSLMPDTFSDLGDDSHGPAVDDYQSRVDDFDLRGPNVQYLPTVGGAGVEEEDEEPEGCSEALRSCSSKLNDLEEEIEELEDILSGAGGCTTIYFNDGIYNTVTGSACLSIREDGKADITWSLFSNSRIAQSGGAGGQYNFRGLH